MGTAAGSNGAENLIGLLESDRRSCSALVD